MAEFRDKTVVEISRALLWCGMAHPRWLLTLFALCGSVGVRADVLSTCELPRLQEPAKCGVVQVPENPAKPDGRKLDIAVAVVPAMGGKALPDPILLLMGGPGEESMNEAAFYVEWLEPLRRERDILLIDQRGTGKSHRLGCDLYKDVGAAVLLRDVFPVASAERCARELSKDADLTQYSYEHFSKDIEHIRRLLGYGPLNLFAGSYGTRAAQVFIKTHGASVRTAMLVSVVPIDEPMPLPMAKGAQAAMDRVLEDCAAQSACHAAFPNVRNELSQMLHRLETEEVKVNVPGQATPVRLHRGRAAERLRSMMYRAEGAAQIPQVIHKAYLGNYQPIVEDIVSNASFIGSAISFGLFFSIVCNEDTAFIDDADIPAASAGTYLGDYRVRQQQAVCSRWPKASLPRGYRDPVRTSVPTVFVSGDTDPATPLWFAERMKQGFAQRAEVVLVNRGHTEYLDCVATTYQKFVAAGSVEKLDTSACKAEPRLPFNL
ncbi:alpha/beta hydrolase [Steroidobacter agaridevorans]|nr:alpha/beta hydrolase [Steroidobacter agaridevorans]